MAWVALDRGITTAQELGLPADLNRWTQNREAIRHEVLMRGWDERIGSFVQAYDHPVLDAANLRLPLVGFMDANHPRMVATVNGIVQNLVKNKLVYRYTESDDGLPGTEGTFAICTFWLIRNLIAQKRLREARDYLDHILSFANDVGLFAEQIDPISGRQLGNFPQAFTHLGLLGAVMDLMKAEQSTNDGSA